MLQLMESKHVTHVIVDAMQAAPTLHSWMNGVHKDNVNRVADQYLEKGIQSVVVTFGNDGLYFANKESAGLLQASDLGNNNDVHPHRRELEGVLDTFLGVYAAEIL